MSLPPRIFRRNLPISDRFCGKICSFCEFDRQAGRHACRQAEGKVRQAGGRRGRKVRQAGDFDRVLDISQAGGIKTERCGPFAAPKKSRNILARP